MYIWTYDDSFSLDSTFSFGVRSPLTVVELISRGSRRESVLFERIVIAAVLAASDTGIWESRILDFSCSDRRSPVDLTRVGEVGVVAEGSGGLDESCG